MKESRLDTAETIEKEKKKCVVKNVLGFFLLSKVHLYTKPFRDLTFVFEIKIVIKNEIIFFLTEYIYMIRNSN